MGVGRRRLSWAVGLLVALTSLPAAARAGSTCPAGACVVLDGTRPIRNVGYVAAGLTRSVAWGINNDGSDLAALSTRIYRSAPPDGLLGYDWRAWKVAASAHAATTLILSDLWAE
ncbi:MAG TPA: hypothetical protein VKI19_01145, partial [Acidimicrobiales bacterium]|nr:hypothetical protein [Acidimicrobiales bacterium]